MAKVAICFYGQTRVQDVINCWYKKIESDYDFFISTWDDEQSKKLNFNFIDFDFLDFEKEEQYLQSITPFNAFDTKTNELVDISRNSKVLFVTKHISNVLSLVKKHQDKNNFEYDAIVLIRPDYLIDLKTLKSKINNFLEISDIKKPIISTQSPLINHNSLITINEDMVYIINNKSIDKFLNLMNDLFIERKDIKIKFAYRGPHELIPFLITYNNIFTYSSEMSGDIIRNNSEVRK